MKLQPPVREAMPVEPRPTEAALPASSQRALRILLVCEDVPDRQLGGLAKHVVVLANALHRQGHQVSLLGSVEFDYEDCKDEMRFEGRYITGLPLVAGWSEMRFGFFIPAKRPYFAKRFAEVIMRHAADHDVVHYHGHLPMIGRYIPESVNFIQTRHDQGSECITHVRFRQGDVCNTVDPQDCASCMTARPNALQTAVSAAAVRRYRQETEESFRRHPVVFVSDFLRRNYRRAVPHADQSGSSVIHNFIDETLLKTHADAARAGLVPHTGVRVHIAGRLDAAKAIVEFLDLLVPRLPADWKVRVYGDGNLMPELRRKHGQHPQLEIFGHRGYDEIYGSICDADVAVVPTKCEEAFGAVTVEALRLGKTCFALNRGGTPELAPYGAPGQLRLFDTLADLADALIQSDTRAWSRAYPPGESADAARLIPQLLALYRRRLAPA